MLLTAVQQIDSLDSVSNIVKLISDFGIMLVIVGIFLYVVINIVDVQIHKYRERFKEKNHDELLEIRANIGNQIQMLIEDYLRVSSGDRVQIIEFSNSIVSVVNLPFRYMTCTYEVYTVGMSAVGHKIDRLSTSLFTPFFEKLQYNDYYIFDIDADNIIGGAMYDLMKSQNETDALCKMLKSPKGKAIGYIQLNKTGEFTETDIEEMDTLADKVSALLCVVENEK